MRRSQGRLPLAVLAAGVMVQGFASEAKADPFSFSAGDLVISTVSCSVGAATCNSAAGGLDTASAITLQQYQLGAGGT